MARYAKNEVVHATDSSQGRRRCKKLQRDLDVRGLVARVEFVAGKMCRDKRGEAGEDVVGWELLWLSSSRVRTYPLWDADLI
jgi:hypothetical protein